MKTPPHVVAYRTVISSVTALILLAFGSGLAGHGPLTALHQLASPVTHSLHLDRIGG
jgi:hypothetical protein